MKTSYSFPGIEAYKWRAYIKNKFSNLDKHNKLLKIMNGSLDLVHKNDKKILKLRVRVLKNV